MHSIDPNWIPYESETKSKHASKHFKMKHLPISPYLTPVLACRHAVMQANEYKCTPLYVNVHKYTLMSANMHQCTETNDKVH